MKNTSSFFLVLALVATILFAGCSQPQQQAQTAALQATPQPTPQPTSIKSAGAIGTAGSPYGTILVDYRGKTLYTFADDIPGSNVSACSGSCAALWPAISSDTTRVSSPLVPADFGSFVRADGSEQTTFRGRPLYYSQQDTKAGDVKGENADNIWFVARTSERVQVAHKEKLGVFMTDGSGKTLYYYTKDTPTASACTDACIIRWPAFSADPVTAPSLLNPANFSTVTRADGKKQTAYRGKPLYYFAGDAKAGEVNGQASGGVWYVANVTGGTP